MLDALRARSVEKLPARVGLEGRILFLCEDAGLVKDQLAGKEMEIGRYYLRRGEHLAAINRFITSPVIALLVVGALRSAVA